MKTLFSFFSRHQSSVARRSTRCWCPSPWSDRETCTVPSAIWIAAWVTRQRSNERRDAMGAWQGPRVSAILRPWISPKFLRVNVWSPVVDPRIKPHGCLMGSSYGSGSTRDHCRWVKNGMLLTFLGHPQHWSPGMRIGQSNDWSFWGKSSSRTAWLCVTGLGLGFWLVLVYLKLTCSEQFRVSSRLAWHFCEILTV